MLLEQVGCLLEQADLGLVLVVQADGSLLVEAEPGARCAP